MDYCSYRSPDLRTLIVFLTILAPRSLTMAESSAVMLLHHWCYVAVYQRFFLLHEFYIDVWYCIFNFYRKTKSFAAADPPSELMETTEAVKVPKLTAKKPREKIHWVPNITVLYWKKPWPEYRRGCPSFEHRSSRISQGLYCLKKYVAHRHLL